jgi:hypothetical protein
MDNNQKFWLTTNLFVLIAAVSITIAIASYWIHHNQQITKLVEGGANPIAVMCAMQNDYGSHPTCIVLAAKQK